MTIHGVDVSAYQSETYSTAAIDFVIASVNLYNAYCTWLLKSVKLVP